MCISKKDVVINMSCVLLNMIWIIFSFINNLFTYLNVDTAYKKSFVCHCSHTSIQSILGN